MANNDKNFKVKNGLDVKGSATVDNDLLVSGTLTAKTNTPSADSDVVNKAYVDSRDTHDEAAVSSQIDSAFNVKSTTDLSEGENLYYTTTRADSAFDVRLATKTTTNLAEGNNLYYTTARADSDTRALVDSDYIEGKIKQSFIDTFDTHDSAAVQGQIDASISATDTHDSAAVQGQIDSAVTLAFINGLDASATNWDSDLIPGLVLGTDVNGNYVVDVSGTANQIEVTHTQGEGSTPVIGLPNNVTIDSDLTVNGVIKGPSTMIIDPALHGDSSGTLVILGNLQVDGVSTIIQSNTVSITDKNIVLADSATNGTEANGAGITVNGANASITYVVGNDNWEFNKAPYYLTNRILTTADDLHDSALVVNQIEREVDLAFINALDASATDWDSDLIPALRTDDVNEGTNLYYTNARARASVSGNKGLTYNSSTGVFDIDSANIYAFTIDSARTIGLIDSDYVEARIKQSFIDTFDTHDSAAVVGQINLEVDKAFVDNLDVDAITLGGNDSSYYLDYNNFTNTPTLPAQVISYDSASELADSAVDARTDQDLFTTSDVEFNKVTSNLVGSVHFTAKNDEGTALAKGDVVYIKGISGNTPTVAKADADDATKMPAFGVVYSGANNGANVTITTLSVLEGLDTQTPGWSEGDTLYVSTVAGQLTNTKPTGESSLIQNIGQVTRVDNSAGSIKILGAGRTAATPNLDQNNIFIGNASNQAITMSLDSAVDSDHVQSKIKQSFIDTFDTHDSAAVVGQINLEVDQAFIDQFDTHDSSAVQGQIDSNFASGFTVGGDITFSDSDDLILPDNSKILLGDASDLQIYHDGSNNFIVTDNSSGSHLFIDQRAENKNIVIRSDDGSGGNANYVRAEGATGEAQLYHYGSQKLATKSTGVDVTGEVLADSATIAGDLTVDTNTLYVDATNNRVGVGNTSPATELDVTGTVTADQYNNDEALPTSKPSLMLDFGNSLNVDSRINFSRASTGTYFDGQYIRTAGPDEPRIEYGTDGTVKGLLIEEERTNLITESTPQSGDLDASGGSFSYVTCNFTPLSGPGIHFDTTGVTSYTYFTPTYTAADYTLSVFVEMDDGNAPTFGSSSVVGASNDFAFVIDAAPVNPLTYIVEHFGGNTYRVSATATSVSTTTRNTGVVKYSGNSSRTFKVTGFQLEEGSFPTSYIPTNGTEVTREPDIAYMPVSEFNYNQSAGTVVVDFVTLATFGSRTNDGVFSLRDNSTDRDDLVRLYLAVTDNLTMQVRSNNSTVFATTIQTDLPEQSETKAAIGFTSGSYAASVEGGAAQSLSTDTAFPVAGEITELAIGEINGNDYLNGHIRSLKYWPQRLSDATLQAVTQG